MSKFLRIEYERVLGRDVCDRTWSRVKSTLKITDDSDRKFIPIVAAYAHLRLKNQYRKVTLVDVNKYLSICNNLPDVQCNGEDLYHALSRLQPCPTDQTFYNWGYQIGVPLHKDKNVWYTPEEIKKWVIRIAEQTNFKYGKFDRIIKRA